MVTGATAWTYLHSRKTFSLVFKESLWMGKKFYHTLVNPNQMRHHCIKVQDNPRIHKPMGITFHQEDVTITLYMAGTIVCDDTSSPTKQQLGDCTWIILTYQHDWYPHSVCFTKGSRSEEEGD